MKYLSSLRYLPIITLLLITGIIYSPGLHGPFIFDDGTNIPQTILNNFNWNTFWDETIHNAGGYLGRPLTIASFILTNQYLGTSAFYFKLVNILIHLLNGLLIFLLSSKLLYDFDATNKQNKSIALIATALWLLHPLHVSTVLYAVQRMAELSTFFSLLGIFSYLKCREKLLDLKLKQGLIYGIGVICGGLLATLSKENGLLLPGFLFAIELCLLANTKNNVILSKKLNHIKIYRYLFIQRTLLVSLPLILGGVYIITHLSNFLDYYAYRDFTLVERVLTETKVFFYYLKLILIPQLTDMSIYHDDFPITHALDQVTIFAISGIISWISIIIIFRKKFPLLCLGMAWFIVAHLMESTIFPLELVFEHRNYFASYGLILAVSFYLYQLLYKLYAQRKIKIIIPVILICLIGALTSMRVYKWSSPSRLYASNVYNNPNSPRANVDWANWLIQQGNWESGINTLKKVELLKPNSPGPSLHRLKYYCMHKEPIPNSLLKSISKKLTYSKDIYYSTNSLIILSEQIASKQCRGIQPDIMISLVITALNSESIKHHNLVMAQLHHVLAKLYLYTGKYQLAMSELDKSYHIYPYQLKALFQKVIQQIATKRYEDAIATITQLRLANKTIRFKQTFKIDALEKEIEYLRNTKSIQKENLINDNQS